MSAGKKQRLKEYQRDYREAKKSTFYLHFFSLYKK